MDKNKAITVSQLNELVKLMFDTSPLFKSIMVKGEISNFVHHRTGHLYFSLKDTESAVAAVMFRSGAQSMKFEPEDGMKVIVSGHVSSFPRDGKYQIYVESMEPDGIGSLYLAYEQLKEKLQKEGLFDQSNKKPLPKIPSVVGVITSPTGAAVRDIINITGRRFPYAKILLYPALVQGDGAVDSLIKGVDYFSSHMSADVIIIGRGGGSIEDLWAFNSEKLARKIFECRIPVISAVGHETDFTICDFVSDLRAPTPSGAAEMAVPEKDVLKNQFNNVREKMAQLILSKISECRVEIELLRKSRALQSPTFPIDERRMSLVSLENSLNNGFDKLISEKKNEFLRLSSKLDVLSPLAVLDRGYGIVKSKQGNIIKSKKEAKCGDELTLVLKDGEIDAVVSGV